MKINLNKHDSEIIKKNEIYTLVDNTELKNLVVSKTILHPKKNTTGHRHPGQEEVYYFLSGTGHMKLNEKIEIIRPGDIVLIHDGVFHQVFNNSEEEDLIFVCVFDGKRNH